MVSSHKFDAEVLGFLHTADGFWWAHVREGHVEFNATLTVLGFKALLLDTGEPCQLFQFVTMDGNMIRVIGLPSEIERLNRIFHVPEERKS